MSKPLRIALTKGRLEKDTINLLEKSGFDCTAVREKGRKLILLNIGYIDLRYLIKPIEDIK